MYGRRARDRLTIALVAVMVAGCAYGQAAVDSPEAADAPDVGQQIADNFVNPTVATRPFNGSSDGLKKVRIYLKTYNSGPKRFYVFRPSLVPFTDPEASSIY